MQSVGDYWIFDCDGWLYLDPYVLWNLQKINLPIYQVVQCPTFHTYRHPAQQGRRNVWQDWTGYRKAAAKRPVRRGFRHASSRVLLLFYDNYSNNDFEAAIIYKWSKAHGSSTCGGQWQDLYKGMNSRLYQTNQAWHPHGTAGGEAYKEEINCIPGIDTWILCMYTLSLLEPSGVSVQVRTRLGSGIKETEQKWIMQTANTQGCCTLISLNQEQHF